MLDPNEWKNMSKVKIPIKIWKSVVNPSVIIHLQKEKSDVFDMLEEVLSLKRHGDDLIVNNQQATVLNIMDLFFR